MQLKKHHGNVPMQEVSVYLGWFICSLAAVFYCYEFFLRVAPSVMIPMLMHAYHLHAAEVGVLSAFYYYAYTPLQLPVGILMDRYGPRRLLTLAIFACAIGSYLFVLTQDVIIAEVGRFLVGFGSAFAFVGVLKLASVWLPPERFAMVSGLATMLGMIGAMFGDIILTELVEHIGWQYAMYYSAVFGLVLAVLVWLIVRDSLPEHKNPQKRVDPHQFRDMKHALKAFVYIIKDGRVWINGVIGGLVFIPTTAFAALWGVHYLEQVFHLGSEQAGVAISMIFLGWAVGGPISGWISDFIKRRRLPMTVGSLMAFVLITVVIYAPHFPTFMLYPLLFAFGLFSSAQVIVFAVACDYSSPKAAGTAIAFTNFLVMLGGMIVQPLIGYLLDFSAGAAAAAQENYLYSVHDYRIALAILPAGLLISFILTFFLQETRCKPSVRRAERTNALEG